MPVLRKHVFPRNMTHGLIFARFLLPWKLTSFSKITPSSICIIHDCSKFTLPINLTHVPIFLSVLQSNKIISFSKTVPSGISVLLPVWTSASTRIQCGWSSGISWSRQGRPKSTLHQNCIQRASFSRLLHAKKLTSFSKITPHSITSSQEYSKPAFPINFTHAPILLSVLQDWKFTSFSKTVPSGISDLLPVWTSASTRIQCGWSSGISWIHVCLKSTLPKNWTHFPIFFRCWHRKKLTSFSKMTPSGIWVKNSRIWATRGSPSCCNEVISLAIKYISDALKLYSFLPLISLVLWSRIKHFS